MSISINQVGDPGKFVEPRVVHTKTPDNKELFVLTGVVILDLKGVNSDEWRWETVTISPTIPTPPNKMLVLEQVAPFATLNAILNLGHSINSGFAVDACRVPVPKTYGFLPIELKVAVRDSDAWLFRVGYTATVVGHYADSDIHID